MQERHRYREFDRAARSVVESGEFPGLVAVVDNGQQSHTVAVGSVLDRSSIGPNTIFHLSSMTKPITGAGLLVLIDRGQIGLDESVDRYLPELADPVVLRSISGPIVDVAPVERAIGVRDLLTFTFGFGLAASMATQAEPWPIVKATEEAGIGTLGPPMFQPHLDPETWMSRLGGLPLMAQPGKRWLYNTAASVIGILIQRVIGGSLSEALQSLVFEPLAMRDTSFWVADAPRLAPPYIKRSNGLVEWGTSSGLLQPPIFEDGASGLLSTPEDFALFTRMLLRDGHPILSASVAHNMVTAQLTDGQRRSEGLVPGYFRDHSWGWCIGVDDKGVYGWDGGLGTSWSTDPINSCSVMVFSQRAFDGPVRPRLHRHMHEVGRYVFA